jgi:hypothetical protein
VFRDHAANACNTPNEGLRAGGGGLGWRHVWKAKIDTATGKPQLPHAKLTTPMCYANRGFSVAALRLITQEQKIWRFDFDLHVLAFLFFFALCDNDGMCCHPSVRLLALQNLIQRLLK